MKNLENYGVQELDAREIQETDGGLVFLTVMAVVMAVTIVAAPIIAWQSGRTVPGQPDVDPVGNN